MHDSLKRNYICSEIPLERNDILVCVTPFQSMLLHLLVASNFIAMDLGRCFFFVHRKIFNFVFGE